MTTKTVPTGKKKIVHPLYEALSQMFRADLVRIATSLGTHPRSDYYRDSKELVTLILETSGEIDLKDDWLLRVDVPWTMFKPQPCLEILDEKPLDKLTVEELREICRQYCVRGFSTIVSKAELLKKVKNILSDGGYPEKVYISKITKSPIPRALLLQHSIPTLQVPSSEPIPLSSPVQVIHQEEKKQQ